MNIIFSLFDYISKFQIFFSEKMLLKRDGSFNIDDYNISNNIMYKRCLNIIDNVEDWKYSLGIDNLLGRNILLGVYIIILIYIFITLVLFIKNINQFMISIRGPSFSIMLSIGCMMLIIACALRRVTIFFDFYYYIY